MEVELLSRAWLLLLCVVGGRALVSACGVSPGGVVPSVPAAAVFQGERWAEGVKLPEVLSLHDEKNVAKKCGCICN